MEHHSPTYSSVVFWILVFSIFFLSYNFTNSGTFFLCDFGFDNIALFFKKQTLCFKDSLPCYFPSVLVVSTLEFIIFFLVRILSFPCSWIFQTLKYIIRSLIGVLYDLLLSLIIVNLPVGTAFVLSHRFS